MKWEFFPMDEKKILLSGKGPSSDKRIRP